MCVCVGGRGRVCQDWIKQIKNREGKEIKPLGCAVDIQGTEKPSFRDIALFLLSDFFLYISTFLLFNTGICMETSLSAAMEVIGS